MEYQTFRGSDVREALGAVKAALGPNALIGSTRFVNDGGRGLSPAYVEVLAKQADGHARRPRKLGSTWADNSSKREASGRRKQLAARPTQAARRTANAAQAISGLEQAFERGQVRRPGSDFSKFESQLVALKAMLEELQATRPPREQAQALLAGLGIEGTLAQELSSGAGRSKKRDVEALKQWLIARVKARFDVMPGLIDASEKQVIACVGQTGVGKTTTLAKLAARARLDLGKSVSVISLDTYRVGAAEQWQRYAELMGLHSTVAHDPTSFHNAIEHVQSDVLLVDTPGHMGRSDESWPLANAIEQLRGRRKDTLLVLPAWLRASDAERVTTEYELAKPSALVVTKVDEAYRSGGMLHAAALRELPICYICNGPRVPEDISDASSDALVSAVFRH